MPTKQAATAAAPWIDRIHSSSRRRHSRNSVSWNLGASSSGYRLLACVYYLMFIRMLLYLPPLLLVEASIYTEYRVYTKYGDYLQASYPSLPATFGMPFREELVYKASLVYANDNPQLCRQENLAAKQHYNTSTMAFLAGLGGCSVEEKVRVAERMLLPPATGFLIVHGAKEDDHDDAPPFLKSDCFSTFFRISSVSYQTGMELIDYATSTPDRAAGFPISIDSTPPRSNESDDFRDSSDNIPQSLISHGSLAGDDYFDLDAVATHDSYSDDVLDPDLNMFIWMMILSSLFFACAATSQQRHLEEQRASRDRQINRTDDTLNVEPEYMGRNTITEDDIERYLVVRKNGDTMMQTPLDLSPGSTFILGQQTSAESEEEIVLLQCPICIEDLDSKCTETNAIRLPCDHVFHTVCIMPWLTERQGTCPLCKYDVYQHVQEASALDFSLPSEIANAISRTCQLFSVIFPSLNDSEEDNAEINDGTTSADITLQTAELEMTEPLSTSVSILPVSP